ncbi:Boron transporter 1, partial [Schaereria dolodes]|nr:Boron transporter 1 [Schaereria dolodes]
MESSCTITPTSHLHPATKTRSRSRQKKKFWKSDQHAPSTANTSAQERGENLSHVVFCAPADTIRCSRKKWWRIRPFRGMINDIKRRAPYYWSDWKDAWDYRVVPATVYMYFANILPALAFSLDMFSKTKMSYGVNEVLLASVLGSVVFSVFAAQPLVIVGVT